MGFRNIRHLGAIAAILAGLARALLIVVPLDGLGAAGLETFYAAIDFAILLALFGLAVRLGHRLGLLGLVGLVMAVAGVVVIRTGDRSLIGGVSYQVGAGLLAIGLAVMVAPLILARNLGRVAALLLIASPAAGLIAGPLGYPDIGATLAPALFAAGLIMAGVVLLAVGPAGGHGTSTGHAHAR